eukprot:GHVR01131858.1.p1 GENE.GHVR01131858.1~~GHVR01131858.1.p1  ORF type:complete len:150 (+),score=4.34 GHVR01131858.1:1029-1478(+)
MNQLLGGINPSNFTQMAQMIEINKIQADLVQQTVKRQIERNKETYGYPAVIGKAKIHRDSIKYGFDPDLKGSTPTVCPCCMHRINKQEIKICYGTTDLSPDQINDYEEFQLTSDVSLFFSFIKVCMYYLIIHLIFSAGFNLYSNFTFGN